LVDEFFLPFFGVGVESVLSFGTTIVFGKDNDFEEDKLEGLSLDFNIEEGVVVLELYVGVLDAFDGVVGELSLIETGRLNFFPPDFEIDVLVLFRNWVVVGVVLGDAIETLFFTELTTLPSFIIEEVVKGVVGAMERISSVIGVEAIGEGGTFGV
jgi:hypothetical protein